MIIIIEDEEECKRLTYMISDFAIFKIIGVYYSLDAVLDDVRNKKVETPMYVLMHIGDAPWDTINRRLDAINHVFPLARIFLMGAPNRYISMDRLELYRLYKSVDAYIHTDVKKGRLRRVCKIFVNNRVMYDKPVARENER